MRQVSEERTLPYGCGTAGAWRRYSRPATPMGWHPGCTLVLPRAGDWLDSLSGWSWLRLSFEDLRFHLLNCLALGSWRMVYREVKRAERDTLAVCN